MTIADDKRHLKQFLVDLEYVLDEVIHDRGGPMTSDLAAKARTAWPTVKSALAQIKRDLDRGPSMDRKLTRAGLTGHMLELKRHGFQKALMSWRSPIKSAGNRLLLRLLRWANIFLGSLASIIPAGELVKEYKEAIEAGIEDGEGG